MRTCAEPPRSCSRSPWPMRAAASRAERRLDCCSAISRSRAASTSSRLRRARAATTATARRLERRRATPWKGRAGRANERGRACWSAGRRPGIPKALERLGVSVAEGAFTFSGGPTAAPTMQLVATSRIRCAPALRRSISRSPGSHRACVRDLTPTWQRGFRCPPRRGARRQGHLVSTSDRSMRRGRIRRSAATLPRPVRVARDSSSSSRERLQERAFAGYFATLARAAMRRSRSSRPRPRRACMLAFAPVGQAAAHARAEPRERQSVSGEVEVVLAKGRRRCGLRARARARALDRRSAVGRMDARRRVRVRRAALVGARQGRVDRDLGRGRARSAARSARRRGAAHFAAPLRSAAGRPVAPSPAHARRDKCSRCGAARGRSSSTTNCAAGSSNAWPRSGQRDQVMLRRDGAWPGLNRRSRGRQRAGPGLGERARRRLRDAGGARASSVRSRWARTRWRSSSAPSRSRRRPSSPASASSAIACDVSDFALAASLCDARGSGSRRC